MIFDTIAFQKNLVKKKHDLTWVIPGPLLWYLMHCKDTSKSEKLLITYLAFFTSSVLHLHHYFIKKNVYLNGEVNKVHTSLYDLLSISYGTPLVMGPSYIEEMNCNNEDLPTFELTKP